MSFTTEEQALIGAIKSDVNQIFDEKAKGLISAEAFKSGVADLTKQLCDNAEAVKAIQEAIKANEQTLTAQGLTLQEMQNRASNEDNGDIEKQLSKHIENMRNAVKSRGQYDTVIKTNYTRSSVTSNPMGQMLPDYGLIGNAKFGLYDAFPKIPVGPESNGVIRYIDQTTGTRNAAATAEGSALPESAVAWQGYTLPLEKIGTTIPITEEALRHTARLAAEVEMFLQTDVRTAIESNLATGNGSTPNLKGIYTSATVYTAAAANITDANIFDLLVKMGESITGDTTYGGKYQPNVAFMNISDINKMKLKKDANYNYIIPPFVSRDGQVVNGYTIIGSPFITANTCVLGDSRFAKIYEESGYLFDIGYNLTGDYAKDILTMKAKKFMALLTRTADVTGWRKSTNIETDVNTIGGLP